MEWSGEERKLFAGYLILIPCSLFLVRNGVSRKQFEGAYNSYSLIKFFGAERSVKEVV